jgi:hypothetical protein
VWDLDGPFAKIGFASSLLSAVNVTQFQPVPRRHRPNYASVSRQATVHCMCMPEQRHDVQFLLIFIKNHQFLFFFFIGSSISPCTSTRTILISWS